MAAVAEAAAAATIGESPASSAASAAAAAAAAAAAGALQQLPVSRHREARDVIWKSSYVAVVTGNCASLGRSFFS